MRVALAALNAAGLAARAAHPITVDDWTRGDRAMSPILARRQAMLDAALRALGVEPYHPDSTGSMRDGEPHHWHTAQLAAGERPGLILGLWSGSPEQAVAEIAAGHGAPVAWAVRDDYPMPIHGHYARKYRQRKHESIVAPVTTAPEAIVLPTSQPALFDLAGL